MPVSQALLSALLPLVDQALDLAPPERAGWLAALRETQPELAAELEAVLVGEADLDTRGFLTEAAGVRGEWGLPGLAGQRLGAYTLERPLGQGGMGTVWLARRSDGRYEGTAAVKLLNLALLDAVGGARFRREGSLLARLSHPNIARLLDAGVTDGGQPYLVLEHVEGERIDRYADARHLPPDARIRLFLHVLSAVAHAHANLIVHRDLKPSNILVTADGTVKLLDFGIARLLEDGAPGAEASTLTDAGGRPLTPEYAAPEQVAGGTVTTGTDVYALGVLLYVLLAGRHPTGDGSRTPAEYLKGILDTEPPRLSSTVTSADARATPLERLRRLYAGDLDNIVAKALKKRPEERYTTVGALADDLQRHLNHEPVGARADSLRYRAGKFVRRNRVPVALASVAGLAVVAGIAGTITQAVRATAHAARADSAAAAAGEQRDFALGQLSRAEAVNELNAFLLTDAAPSGKSFTVGDLLARAESLVDREHVGTLANRVEMLVALGQQYLDVDQEAHARPVLARAYGLSRDLRERAPRARAACAFGLALARLGAADSAERLVEEGLALLPDQPLYATTRVYCLLCGSGVARSGGRAAEAIERAETARRLVKQAPSPPPGLALRSLMEAAASYNAAGRRREADTLFQAARGELTSLGRENTQTAVTLFNDWAVTLARMGQPRRAEQLYREALRISSAGGAEERLDPIVLHNLAQTLGDLGRYPEAILFAERANAEARRTAQQIAINATLRTLFALYLNVGDLRRAEAMFAEVEPRLRAANPPGHPVFAGLLSDRAMLTERYGDLDSALVLADRAVRMADTLQNRKNVLPVFLRRRAELELKLHREAAALRDAREAVELTRAQVQPGQPSAGLGVGYLLLGRALRATGDSAGALPAFDSARAHLDPTLGADHPRAREAGALAGRSPRR
jgi:serine/threonine protein kinase/tetratricopeptide (TPR) repeat protein